MTSPTVLVFAREAGAAAALAPVIAELRGRACVLLTAKGPAERVLGEAGLTPTPLPNFSDVEIDALLASHVGGARPDVVLTAATSLPQHDMTEKLLWRWARERGIPSLGVLDQWQHYALRFSGPRPDERLAYLPHRIAAMDHHARRELIACGIPGDIVVVTGQPAFDRLARRRAEWAPADTRQIRERLGVAPGARLVAFVAEPLRRDFAHEIGYDEHVTLRDVLALCADLVTRDLAVHLAVKLHPQSDREEFAWVKSFPVPAGLGLTIHGTEESPLPLALASDVVIGMASTLLLEAILLGRPTVSFQPRARQDDLLVATVIGAIPLVRDRAACARLVADLLFHDGRRARYLREQSRFAVDDGAAGRVASLVMALAKEEA